MATDRVTVELLGLLPEVYRLCTKCQPMDYLGAAGVDYISDQMADYPEAILTEQKKLADLYYRLREDFGSRVRLVPVELTSFRWMWLCLKHGLKNGPALVIEGKRIVQWQLVYEEIRRAVQEGPSSLWQVRFQSRTFHRGVPRDASCS